MSDGACTTEARALIAAGLKLVSSTRVVRRAGRDDQMGFDLLPPTQDLEQPDAVDDAGGTGQSDDKPFHAVNPSGSRRGVEGGLAIFPFCNVPESPRSSCRAKVSANSQIKTKSTNTNQPL